MVLSWGSMVRPWSQESSIANQSFHLADMIFLLSVPMKLGLQNGADILVLDNPQHLEAALVPVFTIQRWETVYLQFCESSVGQIQKKEPGGLPIGSAI